jgi:hypothetical protein
VLAGDRSSVFRHTPGDPHPISFLRVLLGVEMCRHFFGRGPWDALAGGWRALHPAALAPASVRALVEASLPALPTVARLAVDTPMRAFGGAPLRAIVQPERVSPAALARLADEIGPALFTSSHWLWTESLRMLALTGWQLAIRPQDLRAILDRQEQAMLRLGGVVRAA